MALVKCPECGKETSSQAPACPHCGFARPRWQVLKLAVVGVIIAAGCFAGFLYFQHLEKEAALERLMAASSPQEIREMKIREQFSPSTGVNYNLEVFIQQQLLEPESYKHYSTTYVDAGDHLLVKTRFRAKNSFGGFTAQWVEAMITYDGEVLGIVGQGVE